MAVTVRAPNPEADAARPYNPHTLRQARNHAIPPVRHWRLEFYSAREEDVDEDLPLQFRADLRRWLQTRDCGFFWVFYSASGIPRLTPKQV